MKIITNQDLLDKLVKTISDEANSQLYIVGISGLDASGKSQLAKSISEALKEQNKNVLTLSGDNFQFPREYKEEFVEKSWAVQHIKRTIEVPS